MSSSEPPRTPVVPNSNDVLKQNYLQSFKTRKVSFCHGRQNSEPPRMAVVPNRSDVLKQSSLQSFKTRRFGFATDGKTKPLCRTLFIKNSTSAL
ncbi:hypothetical protein DWQ65_08910 [Treponema phagedenis]|nr:hypothetical protein FUT79_02440 [Treponema phagedenis]QEK00148.1 hypothetical protein FUT84_02400 [Treponema phagedenis]QEK04792.1 hypothetical protein FUT83_13975 [Treponema phagedenis]QEK07641.1 hypothetical protein FUT80_13515 [Treponema phagedenis]QEK10412.1 hypothetical protein FUT81_13890 [Treponema phagedenis]